MPLTRQLLKKLGIDSENAEKIVLAHTESVDALKDDNDAKEAEIAKLNKEIKDLKSGAEDVDKLKKELAKYEDLKEKYSDLKNTYSEYKEKVETEASDREKKSLARKMLLEAGISEKRVDSVLRVYDYKKLEIEDGAVKDKADAIKGVKEDWSDFIVSKTDKGADTPNPPSNNGGKKTKDEIFAIKDTAERQKAMAENHELFGI